jgi:hypothetical protein
MLKNAMNFANASICLLVCFLLLLFAGYGKAQVTTSSTDGTTPSWLTPGAPAGSYALSNFDNVNLFNGSLNFHLPLLSMSGRGKISMQSMLEIERRWSVERNFGDNGYFSWDNHYPQANWWNGFKPGYGPGVLQGRSHAPITSECFNGQDYVPYAGVVITRLTFTAPDGTEYELHDQLQDGRPMNVPTCAPQGASRGTIFISADGTAATFVSDTVIYDNPYTATAQYVFNPSGYFVLRDGTRYRIDGG